MSHVKSDSEASLFSQMEPGLTQVAWVNVHNLAAFNKHRILLQLFIAELWFRLSALTAGGPRHRLHSSVNSNVLEYLSLHLSPSRTVVKTKIDVEGIAFYPLRKQCPGCCSDLLLLCIGRKNLRVSAFASRQI